MATSDPQALSGLIHVDVNSSIFNSPHEDAEFSGIVPTSVSFSGFFFTNGFRDQFITQEYLNV